MFRIIRYKMICTFSVEEIVIGVPNNRSGNVLGRHRERDF